MKQLRRLAKATGSFANKKFIIPLVFLFVIVISFMEIGPVSSRTLKHLSGGIGMLDMNYWYNQPQVYHLMNILNENGRILYERLLGMDFLFAIVFMLLESLIITELLKKTELWEKYSILNLLPFLRSAFDALENSLLLIIIGQYPNKLPGIVLASGIMTTAKWVVYYLVMAVILFLLILWIIKSINKKGIKP